MLSGVIGCPVAGSRTPKHSKYTGLPCCWISRIAPGILPVVTSLRTWSPIRSRAAREKVGATVAWDSARSSYGQPVTRTSASAATIRRRPAARLVLQRFIDQLLQRPLDALALRRRLLQHHKEHVLLAVDHQIADGGAIPFQFAERSRRRRLGVTGIGAYGKPKPHAEAVTGKIIMIPLDTGALANMVRCHQLERLRAEIGLAFERTAIEQHLRKARKVRHGRDHAAAGGFPLLANLGPVLAADPEITVVRQRLGEPLQPLRFGDEEAGVSHAERIEQLFPLDLEQ